MKIRKILLPILLLVAIFSCENNDSISVPAIDGLSLYWDHEVFGSAGRRLRFEVYSTNEFDHQYKLEFNTSIVDKSITVRLIKSSDKGKCPIFPMPNVKDGDPNRCNASGEFYFPDKELENGIYSLIIITPTFEVTAELTMTTEKVTLEIPINEYVKSSVGDVYPIPPNLVFGSIVYQDSNNTQDAEGFITDLTNLGLIKTTVPNHSYRHLSVDENGLPLESYWEPDNHSIGFLFDMNNIDFKTLVEETRNYFNQTNLNIYLYTSNGDQGLMSKTEGITIVFGQ